MLAIFSLEPVSAGFRNLVTKVTCLYILWDYSSNKPLSFPCSVHSGKLFC